MGLVVEIILVLLILDINCQDAEKEKSDKFAFLIFLDTPIMYAVHDVLNYCVIEIHL